MVICPCPEIAYLIENEVVQSENAVVQSEIFPATGTDYVEQWNLNEVPEKCAKKG